MNLDHLENDPAYIRLQIELIALQRWVQESKSKIAILFEGRDTAGKGGAIMRFVRYLNPRGYRIVALPKPTELEQGQWYFQRYLTELPNSGEMVFFDRSWYNRAVVEPVMGFCTEDQYQIFMGEVVPLEQMLVNNGFRIFKFWFSIENEEQKKRLAERKTDPLKMWKMSTVDMKAQLKWDSYTKYKNLMFNKTSWPGCPWVVIDGNNKEIARLESMRFILNNIQYLDKGKTGERLQPDSAVITIVDPENRKNQNY